MSTEIVKSWVASEDLSSSKFYLAVLASNTTCSLAGANERAIGVIQNNPESGEQCSIMLLGISFVIAGEAIDIGTMLTAKSDGKAEEADAAGEWVIGYALESAAADGDQIMMLVCPMGDAVATDATAP